MKIGDLFGDYTIEGFRETMRYEYKKETGKEAIEKIPHFGKEIQAVSLGYVDFLENFMLNTINKKLPENKYIKKINQLFLDKDKYKRPSLSYVEVTEDFLGEIVSGLYNAKILENSLAFSSSKEFQDLIKRF
jgi:hypothetical protein